MKEKHTLAENYKRFFNEDLNRTSADEYDRLIYMLVQAKEQAIIAYNANMQDNKLSAYQENIVKRTLESVLKALKTGQD